MPTSTSNSKANSASNFTLEFNVEFDVEFNVKLDFEGDIEFVETLKVAMDALKNEDLKMFDVMTYVEQGMTIRQIEALTGIPKSTVAELRAKGLAKLRLFFDIT